MATIHLGRMLGAGGFSRHVAIKRLHAHVASDPAFVAMLLDEGRMAARIAHPNVVATLDVVRTPDDLFLVMEYVEGVPLSFLLQALNASEARIPVAIAVAISVGVLQGLHAAHEARDEGGAPLGLVHRDVSPQNILLAVDGIPRVVDFGIAKAAGRTQQYTREGEIKGKVPYMAPEQLRAAEIDRRADIWAAAVVLWELLVGVRPFRGDGNQVIGEILYGEVPSLKSQRPDIPSALEAVVLRALARFPERRFPTAREMALELERAVRPATAFEVGTWVENLAAKELADRAALVSDLARREPECVLETSAGQAASMASRTTVDRHGSRLRRTAAALGGLVAVLGAILVVSLFVRKPSVAPDVAAAMAPREAPDASLPSTSPSSAPLAQQLEPSAVRTLALEPSAAPTALHPTRRTAPAPRTTPRTSKSARPQDGRCYRLDADGIWHIRPECL